MLRTRMAVDLDTAFPPANQAKLDMASLPSRYGIL